MEQFTFIKDAFCSMGFVSRLNRGNITKRRGTLRETGRQDKSTTDCGLPETHVSGYHHPATTLALAIMVQKKDSVLVSSLQATSFPFCRVSSGASSLDLIQTCMGNCS